MKPFQGVAVLSLAICVLASTPSRSSQAKSGAVDPGVRGGPPGAGGPLPGLTADETVFFQDGQSRFGEIETVQGDSNDGLGPRFNSNQCLSCHSQPNGGGSSPAQNPLISVATLDGAKNTVPWFIKRRDGDRSEEHTSELQSQSNIVCRLLLEKKKKCSL